MHLKGDCKILVDTFLLVLMITFVLPISMASAQTNYVNKLCGDGPRVCPKETCGKPEASADINLEASNLTPDIAEDVNELELIQVDAPEGARAGAAPAGYVTIYGRFYVYECRCDPINDCNCPCRTATAPYNFCTGNNCTTTPGERITSTACHT